MNATTGIALGVAALAGGLLYLKSRAQPAPGMSNCDAVGQLVAGGAQAVAGYTSGPDERTNVNQDAIARIASAGCSLLGNLRDRIANALGGGPGCMDYNRENEALNGPIVKRISPAFESTADNFMCAKPGVLEYANGCVPYRLHPGFAKCAPGTHHMSRHPEDSKTAGIGTGIVGQDPTTFRGNTTTWLKGHPFTCPDGQTPAVDRREGGGDTFICFGGDRPRPRVRDYGMNEDTGDDGDDYVETTTEDGGIRRDHR